MTWNQTHRRWQALRTIEEQLAATEAAELPWTEEYAELFGTRAGLVTALRYRWNLTLSTQLDTHLPEHVLEEQRRRLTERFRGLQRVLDAPVLDAPVLDAPVLDKGGDEELGTTRAVA